MSENTSDRDRAEQECCDCGATAAVRMVSKSAEDGRRTCPTTCATSPTTGGDKP